MFIAVRCLYEAIAFTIQSEPGRTIVLRIDDTVNGMISLDLHSACHHWSPIRRGVHNLLLIVASRVYPYNSLSLGGDMGGDE
jgi:hypothetical protein